MPIFYASSNLISNKNDGARSLDLAKNGPINNKHSF